MIAPITMKKRPGFPLISPIKPFCETPITVTQGNQADTIESTPATIIVSFEFMFLNFKV